MPAKDREVLRFLWWPEGDVTKPPETYRMTVRLFGGTWSPSVCTYALQQTARNAKRDDFDPDVEESVGRDFYANHFFGSIKTEEETRKIVTELPRLLQGGGFRLHE